MPGLPRRQWVISTLVPALVVWLLAIAPGAVDILTQGGDTLAAFKNGFIQSDCPRTADRAVPGDRAPRSHEALDVVVRRQRHDLPPGSGGL
jgi:hypothetical protein